MTIEEKILEVVNNNLEKNITITMESHLKESGVDSLGKLILIDALEDEFGIEIDEKEFASLYTAKEMVQRVKEKIEVVK